MKNRELADRAKRLIPRLLNMGLSAEGIVCLFNSSSRDYYEFYNEGGTVSFYVYEYIDDSGNVDITNKELLYERGRTSERVERPPDSAG